MASLNVRITGGNQVQKVLAEIGKNVGKRAHVNVGYLAEATYPDGTPVAQVAFWQEFGTPAARFPIPPRPTFRTMIAKHQKEWGPELAKFLPAHNYDAHAALTAVGQHMKEELQDSVLHADVAALSPVTLMLRKMRSDDPSLKVGLGTVFEAIRRVQAGDSGASGTQARRLIDSGLMARASDFEVIDGS